MNLVVEPDAPCHLDLLLKVSGNGDILDRRSIVSVERTQTNHQRGIREPLKLFLTRVLSQIETNPRRLI